MRRQKAKERKEEPSHARSHGANQKERSPAVQPSSRFPKSSANTTTNPEKIPIKLSTTCTKVNVVIPKIMMPIRSKACDCYGAAVKIATHDHQPGFLFCFPAGRKLTLNTISTQWGDFQTGLPLQFPSPLPAAHAPLSSPFDSIGFLRL